RRARAGGPPALRRHACPLDGRDRPAEPRQDREEGAAEPAGLDPDRVRGMPSTGRRHVPFGAEWAVPVDVRVSEWVVAGGAGWSCGQCPLDARGEVVAPGNIDRQAALVADRIEAGLGRAGLDREGVLALVVYGVSPRR